MDDKDPIERLAHFALVHANSDDMGYADGVYDALFFLRGLAEADRFYVRLDLLTSGFDVPRDEEEG